MASCVFWLGWAQQVGGDHAAAQESWQQARSELEPFLKEQPENYNLMQDLALVEMGLGNKAAALSLAERAIATNPIEKDVVDGPAPIEILARVAGADRRSRPRHRSLTETALDTVRAAHCLWQRAAHSCAAPARSDVRSAPERSALPKTRRRTSAEINL